MKREQKINFYITFLIFSRIGVSEMSEAEEIVRRVIIKELEQKGVKRPDDFIPTYYTFEKKLPVYEGLNHIFLDMKFVNISDACMMMGTFHDPDQYRIHGVYKYLTDNFSGEFVPLYLKYKQLEWASVIFASVTDKDVWGTHEWHHLFGTNEFDIFTLLDYLLTHFSERIASANIQKLNNMWQTYHEAKYYIIKNLLYYSYYYIKNSPFEERWWRLKSMQ
jgi:hypothetical protein